MRILLSLVVSSFTMSIAVAQNNGIAIGGKWADQVSISDVNGRPFEKKYEDVNGHPFFDPAFKYANITLTKGRTFTKVKTKINLLDQTTVFITSNNIEAFIERAAVKEIRYNDTSSGGIVSYIFQTGFPAVDRQLESNFYQVLSAGHCMLLKSITKSIAEKKNELSGELARDMETTENIYLFCNGTMNRVKKDKGFVLGILADKKEQLTRYFDKEKPSLKNTGQLVKLVDYYNSL
jgi:hypothetical protein